MERDVNEGDSQDNIDFNSLTVAQLKELLDSEGISYTSTMRKEDLISLLENSEG